MKLLPSREAWRVEHRLGRIASWGILIWAAVAFLVALIVGSPSWATLAIALLVPGNVSDLWCYYRSRRRAPATP